MSLQNFRFVYMHELYTAKKLSGVSLANWLLTLLRELNKTHNVFCYYIVPAEEKLPYESGHRVVVDDFIKELPYVKVLPIHHYAIPPAFEFPPFDLRTVYGIADKELVYDFVLSNRICHNFSLKFSLLRRSTKWNVALDPLVISHYTETSIDDRLPTLGSFAGQTGVTASMTVCPTIVMNEYDRQDALKMARERLAPSIYRNVAKNIHVSKACISSDELDADFPSFEKQRQDRLASGKINVFHGGSLEPKRHLPDMVEAVKKVREAGQNVEFVNYTQVDKSMGQQFEEYEWFKFKANTMREQYVRSFGEGDILWMGADYEGTGIAYMEAIRSGMIPLALRNVWTSDRLGRDYPFFIDSLAELDKMLLYMVKNFAEIKSKYQKILIDKMDEWTTPVVAEEFMNLSSKLILENRNYNQGVVKKNFARQFLEKALETTPDTIELYDMYERMKGVTVKGLDFRWVTLNALRAMMIDLGFEDLCDGEKIIMRRNGTSV
jgi:glycosyltransferase involved in cell wall biosynthesis